MRLLIRLRRHSCAERLELLIRLRRKPLERGVVASAAHCADERRVELPEPVDQRLARIAAEALGLRARRIELAHDIIEDWIKRSIAARAQRGQAGDDALEVGRKAGSRT